MASSPPLQYITYFAAVFAQQPEPHVAGADVSDFTAVVAAAAAQPGQFAQQSAHLSQFAVHGPSHAQTHGAQLQRSGTQHAQPADLDAGLLPPTKPYKAPAPPTARRPIKARNLERNMAKLLD
jgi:hypothetical protein